MGWDYTRGATKSQVVKELVSQPQIITHKLVGNELWTIYRPIAADYQPTVIVLYLLGRSGGSYGYKSMTEEMGPYYFKCPLAFLDMVPATCDSWREQVRRVAAGGLPVWDDSSLPDIR